MVGASADWPSRETPIPRTRLIGRDAERGNARVFLTEEAVPLLTLTGPGGVGKTRLALAIASEVAIAFADGTVFVDLAPLVEPALVTAAVATALDLTPRPGQSLADAIVASLRPTQRLLILDNCEHVSGETGDLVTQVLASCPAVQVLATSRAPLRVRGEQLLPVEPLSVPASDSTPFADAKEHAAVRLFAARARAMHPTFRLDDGNVATITALCRALDGLPLAIELAAARLTIFSPQQLLAHLNDRLHSLGDGPRELPARQQTITATISWSYALLAPEAQRLFRWLAVFAGGFTLEAVQTVAGGQNTMQLLTNLIDQSLVQRRDQDEELRFTMLETVRAYALEQLIASGEESFARDAHAAWALALAEASREALRIQTQPVWLRRLDRERDNLRIALTWLLHCQPPALAARLAVALDLYWYQRGAMVEARTALQAARSLAGLSPALVAATMACEATFAHYAGDYAATERLAVALLAHGRREGDITSEAMGYGYLSRAAGAYGANAMAAAYAEQSLARFRLAPDPLWLPLSINRLGIELTELGEYDRAQALYEEALLLFREQGNSTGSALTLGNAGALQVRMGQPDQALALFQGSLRLAWEGRYLVGCTEVLTGIAAIAVDLAASELATEFLGASDALCAQTRFSRYGWGLRAAVHVTEEARIALGESGFRQALERGAQLESATVVAAALTLTPLDLPRSLLPPDAEALPNVASVDVALTTREKEILNLLCERQTNPEIAERLFLSIRTVESHVRNILGKLGACGPA